MKRLVLSLLLVMNLSLSRADIVIVNNPTIPQVSLYRYELQSIFMLNINYWRNGVPITPIFINFDNPIHNLFLTHVLKVSPYNFNLILSDKIQIGESKHFIVVNSIAEAIQKVKQINGAIAYVSFTDFITHETEIRIIHIID